MQINRPDSTEQINVEFSITDSTAMITADSVPANAEIKAFKSLFQTEAKVPTLEEEPLPDQVHPVWVPMMLLVCFILLAWGRLFFRRRLDMIFRAVFAKNYANQLIREGNIFNERIGLILFFNYINMMALFVYLSLPILNIKMPNFSPFILYLILAGAFLGLWAFKIIIVRLLSVLFNTLEYSRDLLANLYIYNLFAGIIMLPTIACMAYADSELFFYILLAIIPIVYLLRIIRAAAIGFKVIKFSVFHLLLYLCTLEILPLIVLAKILTRNMIL